ncbi:helix-turn-helix domain-containing protein [Streptosporangium sp. NPDC004631]
MSNEAMRIGEPAALAGVSTRTVRHHHLGLLPEPVRLANGYREYRLRDAVTLARIRQLAGLGLSLYELRDALVDDEGRELREVLLELDADLAKEQEAISVRRDRLAVLLAEADLHADSMVSRDMAAVLRDLPAGGSRFAEIDRDLLTLVNMVADPADQARILDLMRPSPSPPCSHGDTPSTNGSTISLTRTPATPASPCSPPTSPSTSPTRWRR